MNRPLKNIKKRSVFLKKQENDRFKFIFNPLQENRLVY